MYTHTNAHTHTHYMYNFNLQYNMQWYFDSIEFFFFFCFSRYFCFKHLNICFISFHCRTVNCLRSTKSICVTCFSLSLFFCFVLFVANLFFLWKSNQSYIHLILHINMYTIVWIASTFMTSSLLWKNKLFRNLIERERESRNSYLFIYMSHTLQNAGSNF